MTTRRTVHPPAARRGIRSRLRRVQPVRLIPPETRVHLRNAGREQLLAVRSVLDAAIERLDRRGGRRP